MLKKIFIITVLTLSSTLLWSNNLVSLEGSKTLVPKLRESTASYHGENDDLHLYNSSADDHVWAVRFDFDTYYAGTDSVKFEPHAINFWMPQAPLSPVTIELAFDSGIQPDDAVPNTTTQLMPDDMTQGWNKIDIPVEAYQQFSQVWLIMHYNTNVQNQQVAASQGLGKHSWWKTPGELPEGGWWAKFSEHGILAELMFSLSGQFILPNDMGDFYLEDFDIEITPGANGSVVVPFATLSNIGQTDFANLGFAYSLVAAHASLPTYSDTLAVGSLAAGQSIELTSLQSELLTRTIPELPSQYRAQGTIIDLTKPVQQSEDEPETDVSGNNTKGILFDTFNVPRDLYLCESFFDYNNSNSELMWNEQKQLLPDNFIALSWFSKADNWPYYCLAGAKRFDWYRLNGYPYTVIESNNRISGYNQGYSANLEQAFSYAGNAKTFIVQQQIEAHIYPPTEYRFDVTLANANTGLFSWWYSLGAQSAFRLHAALVQPASDESCIHGWLPRGMVTETDGISVNLSYMEQSIAEISFDTSEYTLLDEFPADSLQLLYWVERKSSTNADFNISTPAAVLYANMIPLSNFTGTGLDITRLDMNLEGEPGRYKVTPTFTLVNNGDTPAVEPIVSFHLENARTTGQSIDMDLEFTEITIDVGGEQEFAYNAGATTDLATYNTQYLVTAQVKLPDDDNFVITPGNTKVQLINCFGRQRERVAVENFPKLDNDDTEKLWRQQEEYFTGISDDTTQILNWFTRAEDTPLYRPTAIVTLEKYGLTTIPSTLISGKYLIDEVGEGFSHEFVNNLDSAKKELTFVALEDMDATYKADTQTYSLDVDLKNDLTRVFPWYQDLRFYAVLAEDADYEDNKIFGDNFIGWLTSSNGSTISLGYAQSNTAHIEFTMDNFETLSGINNLYVHWWVEAPETTNTTDAMVPFSYERQKLAAGRVSLPTFRTSLSDINSPPRLVTGPNPFSLTNPLNIRLENSGPVKQASYKVYNLKGQLVYSLNTTLRSLSWDGKDTHNRPAASGVYLVKAKIKRDNMPDWQGVSKCLLLK